MNQPENTTAGRCRQCWLIYFWHPSKERRLKDARCALCGRYLTQTTTALLKRDVPKVAQVPPVWDGQA